MWPSLLFQDEDTWLVFEPPHVTLHASKLSDVLPLLDEVDRATRSGKFAIGFVTYEAAPAFDPALIARKSAALPLAWFAICEKPRRLTALPAAPPLEPVAWNAELSAAEYATSVQKIKDYIAAGDTYQVNFTWRLRAKIGNPFALFSQLARNQHRGEKAFIHTDAFSLCSASPELFFERREDTITCRPMKGTAPRGRSGEDDRAAARWLRESEKDRAENLMIVDMMRNDLGRIANLGSVEVSNLFEVARYETLWQMTSTVRAKSSAALPEIFRALFPCASVTGAPKVRAMQLIAELESSPRGIYTGAIGWIAPNGAARFNVAIRTCHLDHATGIAEYGTGSGITWESGSEQEWEECAVKARVLTESRPDFQLLETLRWSPQDGYDMPAAHLDRLADSADYFEFPFDRARAESALRDAASRLPPEPRRVRLLLSPSGAITVEDTGPVKTKDLWRVALADQPVQSADPFLYHKTTHRAAYEQVSKSCPDADDLILWNERGEVTESRIANIVIQKGRDYFTPPVSSGLLSGVLRKKLVAEGQIVERVIRREELRKADAIFLINSVRGWMRAALI